MDKFNLARKKLKETCLSPPPPLHPDLFQIAAYIYCWRFFLVDQSKIIIRAIGNQ